MEVVKDSGSDKWLEWQDGYPIESKDLRGVTYTLTKNSDNGNWSVYRRGKENGYVTRFAKTRQDAENEANADSRKYVLNDTKFSQYQLPGEKENYKEVLVTMPKNEFESFNKKMASKYGTKQYYPLATEAEQAESRRLEAQRSDVGQFKSSHWEEPNVLVHLRMNTRTDSDGNKVLFLEEVQSDWGQKGKKDGYRDWERSRQGMGRSR